MTTVPDWLEQAANSERHSRYVEAALQAECSKIAAELNGSRNEALNKSAYSLAQLVAGGHLDEQLARHRLRNAALECGLEPDEINATIESAFQGGLQSPRDLPRNAANGADRQDDESGRVRVSEPFKATPYTWIDTSSLTPRKWLYGRHYIREFVSVTVAPGGVGKSSLTMAEALAMVSGKSILGVPVETPLSVWLWNLEDPRDELSRRIQAACQHYELTADDICDRLYVNSGRETELCIAVPGSCGALILMPVIENLVEEMKQNKIDVLIVDPFISSHQVSENDNLAMDDVAKAWGKVAQQANASISLVHHTRKMAGDLEVTAESSRGGKALTDAARDVRALNRMSIEEGKRAGVENHRCIFRAYSDKANLAPPAETSDWYILTDVKIRNGDHVGVVCQWSWPSPLDDLTIDDLKAVQQAIHGKKHRRDVRADDWVGIAIADILNLDLELDEDKEKVKSCLRIWLKTGALKEVSVQDENRKKRKIVEVGEWAD